MNQLEKQTLVGLAGYNYRTFVASLKHQTPQAQVEAAFQFFAFTVTFEAMRLEDRAYVFLEGRWSSREGMTGREQQTNDYNVKRFAPGARLCPPGTSRSSIGAREALSVEPGLFCNWARCGWSSTQPRSSCSRDSLHASRKISVTTRHGLLSVMRCSWPLWW